MDRLETVEKIKAIKDAALSMLYNTVVVNKTINGIGTLCDIIAAVESLSKEVQDV